MRINEAFADEPLLKQFWLRRSNIYSLPTNYGFYQLSPEIIPCPRNRSSRSSSFSELALGRAFCIGQYVPQQEAQATFTAAGAALLAASAAGFIAQIAGAFRDLENRDE